MTTTLYYSTDDLRSRLSIGGTSGDAYEPTLLQACRTATRRVSAYTGQRFDQHTGDKRFGFPGNPFGPLYVDPYVSINQIAINTTGKDGAYDIVYLSTDVRAKFEKARSGGFVTDWMDSDALPYDMILRTDGNVFGFQVPFTDYARIKVTGIWGWPVCPEDISEAAGLIAAQIYKIRDSPFGVAGVADLGLVTVRQLPIVRELLAPYRTIRAIGV